MFFEIAACKAAVVAGCVMFISFYVSEKNSAFNLNNKQIQLKAVAKVRKKSKHCPYVKINIMSSILCPHVFATQTNIVSSYKINTQT